ncbi:MAG TPA: hypothetical protein VMG58_08270 [Candidatus Sulfotelmatobacter sp.]|nr:hypothetical protein [Candidatus Sulfotelmatobacter sp.]
MAAAHAARQAELLEQGQKLMTLLEQNTELTRLTEEVARRIAGLTEEVHRKVGRVGDSA